MTAGRRLTHLGRRGEARMVDVSAKPPTERVAIAEGRVIDAASRRSISCARGDAKKGDVIGAARIAGIMAAKENARVDPAVPSAADHQRRGRHRARRRSCPGLIVRATVRVTGKTGVEMEALTAVSVACLTIYDMVKAVERGMRIEGIRLIEKRGGKSGTYRAEAEMALLSVADALARVLADARALPAVDGRLSDAHGRVLAADLVAQRTQPPARGVGDGRLRGARGGCRARARRR